MTKFDVYVDVTMKGWVEVEADNLKEATEIANAMNPSILIDAVNNNFSDVEVEIVGGEKSE